MLPATMPDLREIILREMGRRKWSNYRLVKELAGKRDGGKDVPPATVYQFLEGRNTSIKIEYLGLILDALELEVKRK